MQEIIMPKLGLTMTQGKITRWLKREGDFVKAGEAVVEIETDKINAEVESPVDGQILKILAQEGEEREITLPIALVGDGSELEAELQPVKEAENIPSAAGRIFITPIARRLAAENGVEYKAVQGSGPLGRIVKADILKAIQEGKKTAVSEADDARVKISPLAKKLAEDNGLDYLTVKGTGPDGRIVKEDILQAIARKAEQTKTSALEVKQAEAASAPAAGSRRIPLAGMRKVIARRLAQSKRDIPHVYFKSSVDATGILELKKNVSRSVEAKTGKKLSLNEIVIKAAAVALEDFPDINASLVEDEILYHDGINIGMAVSLEKGLVVPVIKDANRMSLSEINRAAGYLASKAREGKLKMEEMSGGTFTISNLGAFGIDEFSAIINPPESAILAVGAAVETPCAENGQVVIKSKMMLTLSVDHRLIDGALAAQFMKRLKELLEDPYLLFV